MQLGQAMSNELPISRVTLAGASFRLGDDPALTKAVAKELFQKATKERALRRKKLKAATTNAERANAQYRYYKNFHVKLASIIYAARNLDDAIRPSVTDCEKMAKQLNLAKPISEPAQLRKKAKSAGGHRYYLDFGPMHSAAQNIVADMLRETFKPKAFQYGVRGSAGISQAISEAKKLISDGYKYARRLDIKNFFDSFNHSAILASSIPISGKVVEHVVIGRYISVKVDVKLKKSSHWEDTASHISLIATQGIPQGSACSPLVAAFFVWQLNLKLPAGTKIINYVDDFLILAKTPNGLEQASQALEDAIASLPVGSFELSEKSGSSLPQPGSSFPFEFLGHHFDYMNGGLLVSVTEANVSKGHTELMMRMASIELAEMKFAEYPKLMRAEIEEGFVEMVRFLLGWENAFKSADDIVSTIEKLMENLEWVAQKHQFIDIAKALQAAYQKPLHLIDPY